VPRSRGGIRVKSIFTIHAGEFLVGSEIEKNFPGLHVWVPSRDTGIDLLVTDPACRRSVSLQVKFSRDFLVTHMKDVYQPKLRACGWWKFDQRRLGRSNADYWVLVLVAFQQRSIDYVVVRPTELAKRLQAIHGHALSFQSYFWVTAADRCFETRGLKEHEQLGVAAGSFRSADRNFSKFLNDWSCLDKLRPRTA